MTVTKDGFKHRQLHIEDYLQMVSAEQKEYAEVSAHQRIAENNDIITDFQTDNLMEQILHKDNLNKAYKKVKSNKGAGGVDGMSVDELLGFLRDNQKQLIQQIKDGKYKSNPFRRVEIPKETKGEFRKLGVPYIEGNLFLKVNRTKTSVAHISKVKYLGYSFYRYKGKCRFRVHPKSVEKMKNKIRELTDRSNGWGNEYQALKLTQFIRGWVNYFGKADMKSLLRSNDEWLRHRIRAIYWKQWKKVKTKFKELKKLGVEEEKAWICANMRKLKNRRIPNGTYGGVGDR